MSYVTIAHQYCDVASHVDVPSDPFLFLSQSPVIIGSERLHFQMSKASTHPPRACIMIMVTNEYAQSAWLRSHVYSSTHPETEFPWTCTYKEWSLSQPGKNCTPLLKWQSLFGVRLGDLTQSCGFTWKVGTTTIRLRPFLYLTPNTIKNLSLLVFSVWRDQVQMASCWLFGAGGKGKANIKFLSAVA